MILLLPLNYVALYFIFSYLFIYVIIWMVGIILVRVKFLLELFQGVNDLVFYGTNDWDHIWSSLFLLSFSLNLPLMV